MSPRPRKASDDEVFAAAQRVMMRVAPAQLTLARIAQEAGVTAGALVQRFGSRRGLMLALMERFSGSAAEFFAQLRARAASPLGALRAYAEHQAQMAESPATLAHHLSYLQMDLADPDLHAHLRKHAADTRAEIERMLADAIAAGELRPETEVPTATRAVQAVLSGSLFVWAQQADESAAEWVRGDLRAVLRPYLTDAGTAALG